VTERWNNRFDKLCEHPSIWKLILKIKLEITGGKNKIGFRCCMIAEKIKTNFIMLEIVYKI